MNANQYRHWTGKKPNGLAGIHALALAADTLRDSTAGGLLLQAIFSVDVMNFCNDKKLSNTIKKKIGEIDKAIKASKDEKGAA